MRKFNAVIVLLLSLFAGRLFAQAQENRFLYLQTDDGQPFYAKTGGVHHSSTISGFLILSRLQDSVLDIVIGFPRDIYPAQSFKVSPLDRDRGMVLKRQGDGSWVLFDLHTVEAIPGRQVVREAPAPRQSLQPATRDSFTTMLSTAIGDSTLLETRVAHGGRAEQQPAKPGVAAAAPDTTVGRPADVAPLSVPKSPSKADTVTVSVSKDTLQSLTEVRPAVPAGLPPAVAEKPSLPSDSAGTAAKVGAVDAMPTLPSEAGGKGGAKASAKPDRTDCKSSESVAQLGDLRRRMEALRDEEAQVAEAVREMRLRCFSTAQVRSLLVVFGREEGRFKLMNAAYPLVRDPSAYPDLLPILKDPYFIHRFKRMTGMPVE
jgi:hypothetical protein